MSETADRSFYMRSSQELLPDRDYSCGAAFCDDPACNAHGAKDGDGNLLYWKRQQKHYRSATAASPESRAASKIKRMALEVFWCVFLGFLAGCGFTFGMWLVGLIA
jgi:hypothetical protein